MGRTRDDYQPMAQANVPAPASFPTCWAKLERAKAHRDDLENRTTELHNLTATAAGEFEASSGYHVFQVESMPDYEPLRQQIGLITGDAIQNIRAALDHLVWRLADWFRDGTPRHPRRVQFPIVRDPSDWPQAEERFLEDVHPEHRALIEQFQPYHGLKSRPDSWTGDYVHQLALLQELSNDDKHRLITPVFAIPNSIWFAYPAGVTEARRSLDPTSDFTIPDVDFDGVEKELRPGAVIWRVRLSGASPSMSVTARITPSVELSEDRPLLPTLDRVATFAALIVHEFEGRA